MRIFKSVLLAVVVLSSAGCSSDKAQAEKAMDKIMKGEVPSEKEIKALQNMVTKTNGQFAVEYATRHGNPEAAKTMKMLTSGVSIADLGKGADLGKAIQPVKADAKAEDVKALDVADAKKKVAELKKEAGVERVTVSVDDLEKKTKVRGAHAQKKVAKPEQMYWKIVDDYSE